MVYRCFLVSYNLIRTLFCRSVCWYDFGWWYHTPLQWSSGSSTFSFFGWVTRISSICCQFNYHHSNWLIELLKIIVHWEVDPQLIDVWVFFFLAGWSPRYCYGTFIYSELARSNVCRKNTKGTWPEIFVYEKYICLNMLYWSTYQNKNKNVVLICDILLSFRNLQNYLLKIVLERQINKFPSLSLYKILTSITSVWVPHSLVNEDQTGYDCIMLARKMLARK